LLDPLVHTVPGNGGQILNLKKQKRQFVEDRAQSQLSKLEITTQIRVAQLHIMQHYFEHVFLLYCLLKS